MDENKYCSKKLSLLIRKHLFKNKPYPEFDSCHLCGKKLTYKNSEIVLVTEDFLPACACKQCRKEIKKVRNVIEDILSTEKFNTKKDYIDAACGAFEDWVYIKRSKLKNL